MLEFTFATACLTLSQETCDHFSLKDIGELIISIIFSKLVELNHSHGDNLGSHVVVVVLGFTTLLTSQIISVAFYIEHEKSDKFCSEALISA